MSKLTQALWKPFGLLASIPFIHTPHKIPQGDFTRHTWQKALADEFNKPGMRVLEVGSRVVTGANMRSMFDQAEYVGFDFHDGPNVDVVGDAHKLASYFPGQKFDLIYSAAVFEHLAMPWIVAEEIASLLNVGGKALTLTHFSFASHERPWHFFQFSDNGLHVLFNDRLGFRLVTKGMSGEMVGYFKPSRDPFSCKKVPELYAFSMILVEKVSEGAANWRDVDVNALVGGDYPEMH